MTALANDTLFRALRREPTPRPQPPSAASKAQPESLRPLDRRDCRLALLLALVALVVFNANLRLIAAGDSYPARFIPFALWGHGTLYLDPVLDLTIQADPNPYWVLEALHGHKASLYPVTTPVLVAPLYLPAVAYLSANDGC